MYQCRRGQAKARAVTPEWVHLCAGWRGDGKDSRNFAKAYHAPAAVDMNPDKQAFPEIQTHLT